MPFRGAVIAFAGGLAALVVFAALRFSSLPTVLSFALVAVGGWIAIVYGLRGRAAIWCAAMLLVALLAMEYVFYSNEVDLAADTFGDSSLVDRD